MPRAAPARLLGLAAIVGVLWCCSGCGTTEFRVKGGAKLGGLVSELVNLEVHGEIELLRADALEVLGGAVARSSARRRL